MFKASKKDMIGFTNSVDSKTSGGILTAGLITVGVGLVTALIGTSRLNKSMEWYRGETEQVCDSINETYAVFENGYNEDHKNN